MSAENVSVVFDRRKKVESTGQGMLEIRVYLGKRVRRYYSIGKFSPSQWKKSRNVCRGGKQSLGFSKNPNGNGSYG